MLNNIDLNKLKVFSAIYRNGSIGGAAKEVHVTPSAVCQSLSVLESSLDRQLFIRHQKGVVPTAIGQELFESVSPSLEDIQIAVQSIADDEAGPMGTLRIGTPPEFGVDRLSLVIAKFRERFPKVDFELIFGFTDRFIPMLIENKIDMVFFDAGVLPPTVDRRLSARPAFEENMVLVCEKRFYEREITGDHSFKNLVSKPHVLYLPSGDATAHWYRHHFNKVPTPLPRSVVAENTRAIIKFAKLGLGLALIPLHKVDGEIARGKLIHIRTKKSEMKNRVFLVQAAGKKPNLTEREFTRFLKEEIPEKI